MEPSKWLYTLSFLLLFFLGACSSVPPPLEGVYGNLKLERVGNDRVYELVRHKTPFGLEFKSEYLNPSNNQPLFTLFLLTRAKQTIGMLHFYRKECDGAVSFRVGFIESKGTSYQYYDDEVSINTDIDISTLYTGVKNGMYMYRVRIQGVDVDFRSNNRMKYVSVTSAYDLKVNVIDIKEEDAL